MELLAYKNFVPFFCPTLYSTAIVVETYCVSSDIHWCILLFYCGMLVAAAHCH